jgi:membrane peptidoglycan carboxypeptidase
MLAGAIVNPRLLSPAHPTPRLLQRQQIILRRMGAVTPPHEEMTTAPVQPAPTSDEPAPAPAEPQIDAAPLAPIAPTEEPK